VINQGSDLDVELDYIIDSLRKASADLVLDLKFHKLKMAQEQHGPKYLGASQKRLSSLEHLLVASQNSTQALTAISQ